MIQASVNVECAANLGLFLLF